MADDLVPGIGDEVLLFGSFLLLSLCMLVFISRRQQQQQRRRPQRQEDEQRQTEHGQAECDPRIEDASPSDSSTNAIPSHDPEPADTELRSRFNPSRISQTHSTQTDRGGSYAGGDAGTDRSDAVSLRLIMSENSLTVNVSPNCTLGELRRTYFQSEISQNRPVRFIYRGRVLSEDTLTLEQLEMGNQGAIHVHIGRPQPTEAHEENQQEIEMLDLSKLFIPFFGLILAIVWVFLLTYPYVFSTLTKIFLYVLSLGYVYLTYISMYG